MSRAASPATVAAYACCSPSPRRHGSISTSKTTMTRRFRRLRPTDSEEDRPCHACTSLCRALAEPQWAVRSSSVTLPRVRAAATRVRSSCTSAMPSEPPELIRFPLDRCVARRATPHWFQYPNTSGVGAKPALRLGRIPRSGTRAGDRRRSDSRRRRSATNALAAISTGAGRSRRRGDRPRRLPGPSSAGWSRWPDGIVREVPFYTLEDSDTEALEQRLRRRSVRRPQ